MPTLMDAGGHMRMNERRQVTSVVLTGTKGKQLHFEKAFRKDASGRTYLDRMIALASAHAEKVFVVTPAGVKYSDVPIWKNVEILPEDEAERGSLGGIQTALRRTTSRYLLCLTCDMPYVNETFIEHLGFPSVQEHGRFTKRTFFPFVLKNDVLVAKTLSQAVRMGLLSVESFLSSVRARAIGPGEVPGLLEVSTPSDERYSLAES